MDAHWYVVGQAVYKKLVVQPSILKQAHIASTALLGHRRPLTVSTTVGAVNCYFQAAAPRNAIILSQSMAAALCIPPVNPNPGSHTPYTAPWRQSAFCPLHFSGR